MTEDQAIAHLMRQYGWSRQEAVEYYYYEPYDAADWETV